MQSNIVVPVWAGILIVVISYAILTILMALAIDFIRKLKSKDL